MPRFSANLSMLYPEHPFLGTRVDRFSAAAKDGFKAVEFAFPYDHPRTEIAQRLVDYGLQQVLINAPPGDVNAGERGLACLPGRRDAFRRSILEQALPYALALKCPRVHVMAGVMSDMGRYLRSDTQSDSAIPPAVIAQLGELRDVFVANLAWAAREAASVGVDLLIEPINGRDLPNYFLNRQDDAHRIVEEVRAPNLKVQMDLYHCQIVEGDVATKLRKYLPTNRVGHLQIAGVPDRHEPDKGELRYSYLFDVIDELGWQGYVGCEYRPRGDTSAGLKWLRPHLEQDP